MCRTKHTNQRSNNTSPDKEFTNTSLFEAIHDTTNFITIRIHTVYPTISIVIYITFSIVLSRILRIARLIWLSCHRNLFIVNIDLSIIFITSIIELINTIITVVRLGSINARQKTITDLTIFQIILADGNNRFFTRYIIITRYIISSIINKIMDIYCITESTHHVIIKTHRFI